MFVKKLTKIKFKLVNWPFFSLRFSRFCPKLSLEISFYFFENQIYISISALFLPQKWQKMGNFCHFLHFTLYWWFFYPQFSSKIKFTIVYWPFFSSNFLVFCIKSSPKISSYFQKSNLLSYIGPFFPSKMTKNGKFWPFYPILMAF